MVDRVGVGVPGLDDLLVRELPVYGLLVGDEDKLLYVPFPDGGLEGLLKRERPVDVSEEGFVVKEFPDTIWSVLAVDNVLYVGLRGSDDGKNFYKYSDGVWESLSIYDTNGYDGFIEDIVRLGPEFDNKVVISGCRRVFFDIDGNRLISFKEFESRDIDSVDSVVYDGEGGLFLNVEYYSDEHGLVRVVYEDGKFRLGEEVLHYSIEHSCIYRTRFLGRSSDGSPLIISTVPLKYLVINNIKVEGSNVKDVGVSEHGSWKRLVVLNNHFKDKLVDVLVSGYEISGVVYMEIDYNNCKTFNNPVVVKGKSVITGLSMYVYALGVVRDKELHKRLLSLKDKS